MSIDDSGIFIGGSITFVAVHCHQENYLHPQCSAPYVSLVWICDWISIDNPKFSSDFLFFETDEWILETLSSATWKQFEFSFMQKHFLAVVIAEIATGIE